MISTLRDIIKVLHYCQTVALDFEIGDSVKKLSKILIIAYHIICWILVSFFVLALDPFSQNFCEGKTSCLNLG